ncbi:MAG: hypothetical protein ACI9HH_003028 [Pseudomonadota bacterium]|jgi:hypothetical protein
MRIMQRSLCSLSLACNLVRSTTHAKTAQMAQGRFRPVHVARNRRDREARCSKCPDDIFNSAVVRRASNIAIHDGAERRARHSARRDRNRNARRKSDHPLARYRHRELRRLECCSVIESSIRRWRDFRKRAAVVHRQQHSFVSPALVVDGRTCRGSLGSDRDRQCRNQPSRARCGPKHTSQCGFDHRFRPSLRFMRGTPP